MKAYPALLTTDALLFLMNTSPPARTTSISAQWEQAYSFDGGKTWDINWVMKFTRASSLTP
jgi:hypothetical protein